MTIKCGICGTVLEHLGQPCPNTHLHSIIGKPSSIAYNNKGLLRDTVGAKDTQVGGSHYQMKVQPVDFIVKNNLGYREGNVIKYVARHNKKNGAEDIKKAIHYLEMILEEYNESNTDKSRER